MSIDGILSGGQFSSSAASQRFNFDLDNLFSGGLRLNQVIKGKVMRHYEGSKYGVSFGGEEKVVDSTLALKTGETIYGRVTSLEDKVHLQRVFPDKTENAGLVSHNKTLLQNEFLLQQTLKAHDLTLTSSQQKIIMQTLQSASQPQMVINVALMLAKLGILINQESLQLMLRYFQNKSDMQVVRPNISIETSASEVGGDSADSVKELSNILSAFVDASLVRDSLMRESDDSTLDSEQEGGSSVNSSASDLQSDSQQSQQRPFDWQYISWILNTQNNGSVDHRFVSVPIWFGGKVVEIDIALFSQNHQHLNENGIQYRKLVFSLTTENLGKVDVVTLVANKRLNIVFNLESQQASDFMVLYMKNIKQTLSNAGWSIDEVSYQTVVSNENYALTSVIDHFVTSDSLSRLM